MPLSLNRRVRASVWIILLLLSATACGEVYRWRDEQGHTHFSDRSTPGAETLSITPQPANASGAYVHVRRVHDGDTVLLENGEKVRLLGINTPEVSGGRKQEEAGGQEAKAWLKNKLEGRQVRLEQDVEMRDPYQRLLAHLFTTDGEHINRALVELGYATTNTYPPNMKYVDELLAAEAQAEREKRGLWALPEYRPKPLAGLDFSGLSGWQRLVGKAVALDESRSQFRLHFEGGFEAHIPKENARLFPSLRGLIGQLLELRGWVSRRGGDYSMVIRHPGALVRR